MAACRFQVGAILFVASLVASSANAQIRKKSDRYQFRAKYITGSTIVYDIVTVVTPFGTGQNGALVQKITLPVIMRIQEIRKQSDKDGLKVAKIRSEAGPIKLNGALYRPKTIETVFVDELNRLQGVGSKEIPQFTTPLPEKPLHVGESWSAAIDPGDSLPLSMKVNATYKLLKVDRTFATVAISLVGKGSGTSKIATKGQGIMMLRVRDGTLERVNMTQTVTAAQGVGARTAITVSRRV